MESQGANSLDMPDSGALSPSLINNCRGERHWKNSSEAAPLSWDYRKYCSRLLLLVVRYAYVSL